MSTNPPKAPYGHLPASLGGDGMGKKQMTDLVYEPTMEGWYPVNNPFEYGVDVYYTRPIDPGPEHELVGEDEIVTGEYQYTVDGIEWRNAWSCNHFTAKARCLDDWLAIRRRKVVKEVHSPFLSQHEAAKIMNEQPKLSASPAPGETKGASSPEWIPVSERLPKDGEHFILGYQLSENWVTSDNFYWPLDIAHSPWTHWHPLAPPPQPKTQQEKDEEAYQHVIDTNPHGRMMSMPDLWHAACEYARRSK